MNLARQKTCKSLLQVKQRFVIHFEFQLAMRLPLARQRSCVEMNSSPSGRADLEIGAPIWIRDRLEALSYFSGVALT